MCTNTRQSSDPKLREWMDKRSMAFCQPESKKAGQKIIIDLFSVNGPICRGKHYQPKEQDQLF
ncbi:MAG: hypothetical protein ING61_13415 [Rhodocyclaceae bacterium]|nr:hypothetical protein [Rhodocyclaceae bacterium]